MSFYRVVFACLILCCCSSAVLADLPTLTILTEEFPPYNYSQDGEIKGLSVDVVIEMARRSGHRDYEMKLYPWLRAYSLAKDAPNTAIFSIGRNQSRESLFQWVGVIAPARFYLFSKPERTDLQLDSLEQAKRYRIGTFPKTVREQYLLEKGFLMDKNLVSIYDYSRLFDLLKLGRIDLWAMNELLARDVVLKKGLDPSKELAHAYFLEDLSPEGYYLAFSKQTDPALVAKFASALDSMHQDGSYQKIVEGYLGK